MPPPEDISRVVRDERQHALATLRRLGRAAEAADAYREALARVGNEPERRFLLRRLAEVEGA